MTEYSSLVTSIELRPGIEDASTDQINASIAQAFGQVVKTGREGMEKLEGGGWEIVSHSVVRIQSHLVVTLILRR